MDNEHMKKYKTAMGLGLLTVVFLILFIVLSGTPHYKDIKMQSECMLKDASLTLEDINKDKKRCAIWEDDKCKKGNSTSKAGQKGGSCKKEANGVGILFLVLFILSLIGTMVSVGMTYKGVSSYKELW